jgi:hypothetical protein
VGYVSGLLAHDAKFAPVIDCVEESLFALLLSRVDTGRFIDDKRYCRFVKEEDYGPRTSS